MTRTYNLEFDGLSILFNSADFLANNHITKSEVIYPIKASDIREEAYKVNTNGADVAIQVGIILHKIPERD